MSAIDTTVTVIDAILSLDSDAKVTVLNNRDINDPQITWLDGTSEISVADIKAEMERLQEIEDNK
tara:strand:- start:356 stop:550 length:195 start_codon:yes stop_codon:yes gene_type:complete